LTLRKSSIVGCGGGGGGCGERVEELK